MTGMKKRILEAVCEAALSPADTVGVLANLHGVPPESIRSIDGPPGEIPVRYERSELPGAFATRIGVFVDASLEAGPRDDVELARGLSLKTGSAVICAVPEDHPEAANPYAWLRLHPGREPELVYERPDDSEGIELG